MKPKQIALPSTIHPQMPTQKPQQNRVKSLEKQTKEDTKRRVARKLLRRSLPWGSQNRGAGRKGAETKFKKNKRVSRKTWIITYQWSQMHWVPMYVTFH